MVYKSLVYHIVHYDTLALSLFNADTMVLYTTCALAPIHNLYACQIMEETSQGSAIWYSLLSFLQYCIFFKFRILSILEVKGDECNRKLTIL